jgi:hypothetical protein
MQWLVGFSHVRERNFWKLGEEGGPDFAGGASHRPIGLSEKILQKFEDFEFINLPARIRILSQFITNDFTHV